MTTHALMELADEIYASLGQGASVVTRRAWADRLRTAAAEGGACHCAACDPPTFGTRSYRMVLCGVCGNKRCPHATDHKYICTGSNDVGQTPVLTPTDSGAGRDGERLDFIECTFSGMTNRERYLPVQMIWGKGAMGRTLREACDKYMAREEAATSGAAIQGGG